MIFSKKLRIFVKNRIFQRIEIKSKKDTIWIHCASVGEVNLAEPIIKKYIEKTENNVLLTMMTDTGRATAEKKYNKNSRVELLFFPLDDYFAIKKIINKIILKKLVIIETEIWPNLINICSKTSSVVMINGRISDKSVNSYRKIKFLLKKIIKNIDVFIMQTEKDKERIISLGADKDTVYNYGNLKFNIELPEYTLEELKKLREKINVGDRRVFVAGSTRESEEEYILNAFDELENTLLILVPRHIERTDDICERLLLKYNYKKWSQINEELSINNKESVEKEKIDVIIVDKIGELRKLYAICDISYVGGTLVNIGGHSLLEPLFYRKPPIFGPYIQNIRTIAKEVLERKIGVQVQNGEELKKVVKNYELKLIDDKLKNEEKKNEKEKINKFFKENNQVVELTFKKIKN